MAITHDPATSRLDPDSCGVHEIHGPTRPVQTPGFLRTWFASSADLRSTADTNDTQSGIHWFTPTSVILLFILGTTSAIAHHLHYNALHHTTVGTGAEQRWALWIGSGLSFFTKVTLTAALGISRTQWVWLTLRKKWLTLRGIDAVFGVTSDPTYFTNAMMLRRAKAATIMAISMWMIPIAAILTPGTISVATFPQTDSIPCSVRSLRFPFDRESTATILNNSSLALNLTVIPVGYWVGDKQPWTHNLVQRTLKLSAYTGLISRAHDLPPMGSPSLTTVNNKCGANCSYTVEFLGPSVSCTPFTSWSTVPWQNESQFLQDAFYVATVPNSTEFHILVGVVPDGEPVRPIILTCRSSVAHYTVQHTVMERSFLEPIITKVKRTTLPGFQEYPQYPDTSYFGQSSLMKELGALASGYFMDGYAYTSEIEFTPVQEVILHDRTNVGVALENMAHRMVVSLLGSDLQLDGTPYVLDVTATQQTDCRTTKQIVRYVYSARTLIVVYALAVACALITTLAGFFALGQNGMASTKTPSSMIRTTRNPTLDECIVGQYTLGGDTMSDELEKVQLRFGALRADEKGSVHYALGVRGEISMIKRD